MDNRALAITRAGLVYLGAALLLVPAAAHAQAAEPLTVMSFNIRYGTASDGPDWWDLRRGHLSDLLKTEDPDVIE